MWIPQLVLLGSTRVKGEYLHAQDLNTDSTERNNVAGLGKGVGSSHVLWIKELKSVSSGLLVRV